MIQFATSSPSPSNLSDVPKRTCGVVQVRTKIVRKAKADQSLSEVRPYVERLVRGEEYVTGSKMLAYENVGRAIGKSSGWVRKLIGRHEVALQYFEFRNIVLAYGELCDRIDAAAATERRRAEHLVRMADALGERPAELVESQEGQDSR